MYTLFFCDVFQDQLDEVVRVWNIHRIRKSANQNVPCGRPVVLYSMPELYNRTSHLVPCVPQEIDACRGACVFREYPCDEDVYNLCVK